MSNPTPLLTIGVLGSYSVSNLEYNINTYIGQDFQDYELIFCFDKRQCVPVSSIIDSMNAHDFEVKDRVTIIENEDNIGLIGNAIKIIEEAKGRYIFFVSIKDAFYDTDSTKRIYDALHDHPAQILTFRTLINNSGEWFIHPMDVKRIDTISICYPKGLLSSWEPYQVLYEDNFYLFQQLLLTDMVTTKHAIDYIDENIVVHLAQHKYKDLDNYYSDGENWKGQLDDFLALLKISSDFKMLSKSHIEKIVRILGTRKSMKESLADEIYSTYRLATESLWEVPDRILQYLAALHFLYVNTDTYKVSKLKCFLLRQKLTRMLSQKKRKMLFLTHEYSVWPSMKAVFDEAKTNMLYEVQLVYVPFFHEYSQVDHQAEMAAYQKDGYPIISYEEYDISKEYPDIVFYLKPYDSIPDKFQVKEIRKIINTIVYIPYGMEIGNAKECFHYQCYGNMHYYAKYILAYSPVYLEKMKHYTYTKGRNYLAIGHPRIDLCMSKSSETNTYYNDIRARAKGRKVVLWNTHFTISKGDNWGSFLKWGEAVLTYFIDHPELFLLWRPHPLFYQALAESRGETLEETQTWLYNLSNHENILLDSNASYLAAFQASDAMISDWSSFVPEYTIYRKPLLITPKAQSSSSIFSYAEKVFCLSTCEEDIYRFLVAVQVNEADKTYIPDYTKILFWDADKTVAKQLLNILEHS